MSSGELTSPFFTFAGDDRRPLQTGVEASLGGPDGFGGEARVAGIGGGASVLSEDGLVTASVPGAGLAGAAVNTATGAAGAAVGAAGAVVNTATSAVTMESQMTDAKGRPVERGSAGWYAMALIAIMVVFRLIEWVFACTYVWGGQKVTAYYFWLFYYIVMSIATVLLLVTLVRARMMNDPSLEVTRTSAVRLFFFIHMVVFVIETAWSAQFFVDRKEYWNKPGNNAAPIIGDPEFCTYQRLMATFVFNTALYAAFAFIAWLYVWDTNVDSEYISMLPPGEQDVRVDGLGDSADAWRITFAVGMGLALLSAGVSSMWHFFIITGSVDAGVNLGFFGWWFLGTATAWVLAIIATIALTMARKRVFDDLEDSIDDGQAERARAVRKNYTHHFKTLWSFHAIGAMFLVTTGIFYIVMISDPDLKKTQSLSFDNSRVASPNPLLHTLQESTYYISQAYFVISAAMFPVWVYMAASLVTAWGLFTPETLFVRYNQRVYPADPGAGRPRGFVLAGSNWGDLSEYHVLASFYLFYFITAGLILAELLGWYRLNKYFLTYTAVTFCIEVIYLMALAYMSWKYVAQLDTVGIMVGPTISTVRWRSVFTYATIVTMKFYFMWDFWDRYVEKGNNDVIPKAQIKGEAAQKFEVAVLWWNMWNFSLLLFAMAVFAMSDYINSIGQIETFVPAFSTRGAKTIQTATQGMVAAVAPVAQPVASAATGADVGAARRRTNINISSLTAAEFQ